MKKAGAALSFVFLAGAAFPSTPVFSQGPPPLASSSPTAAKAWKDAAELSFVNTTGNTKTASGSAKNTFNYSWTLTALEFVMGALYVQNGDTATAEQYFANEKLARTITEKNYLYEKVGWDRNRFAGIRSRTDYSAGLGRTFLNFPKNKLTGELGTGYVDEEHTDFSSNKFVSGRAYAQYVHTFSSTANFSQDAEYLPNLGDSSDYRVNTETALTAALSAHFSLKVSYDWKHTNKPPAGFGQNDSITSAALVVNY
jgi:putative salt-induced outer membrane protein